MTVIDDRTTVIDRVSRYLQPSYTFQLRNQDLSLGGADLRTRALFGGNMRKRKNWLPLWGGRWRAQAAPPGYVTAVCFVI